MTTQLTARVSKTIQEQQYEPLTVDLTITETCPKKKYNERLAELTDLLKEEVFAALGIGEEGFEEGNEGEEGFEEGQEDDEFGDLFDDDDPGGEPDALQ